MTTLATSRSRRFAILGVAWRLAAMALGCALDRGRHGHWCTSGHCRGSHADPCGRSGARCYAVRSPRRLFAQWCHVGHLSDRHSEQPGDRLFDRSPTRGSVGTGLPAILQPSRSRHKTGRARIELVFCNCVRPIAHCESAQYMAPSHASGPGRSCS